MVRADIKGRDRVNEILSNWKEVTKEVYYSYDGSDYISMSRAETKDGRYFIVIESGDVKNVIKDLLEELK